MFSTLSSIDPQAAVLAVWANLPIIISLIFLESMLSVDNALVLAAMVSHLPEKQRIHALRWGLGGAYVMRGMCLWGAATLASWWQLKIIGAAYLLYLMCGNLSKGEDDPDAKEGKNGLIWTIVLVEIADLNFSWDNILAATALSPKLWVVCTGVAIGILAMRFIAGWFVKLIEKFPVLAKVAFVLVGFIGFQLIAETFFDLNMTEGQKFTWIIGIVVGGLLYERVGFVNALLSPVFSVLGKVMGVAAMPFDWFFGLLGAGVSAVKGLFSRSA